MLGFPPEEARLIFESLLGSIFSDIFLFRLTCSSSWMLTRCPDETGDAGEDHTEPEPASSSVDAASSFSAPSSIALDSFLYNRALEL